MRNRSFQWIWLALALAASPGRAGYLELPSNLVELSSPSGAQFLQESSANADYFRLADHFVTQKNQAYCGVASLVMVLNALALPAPTPPEYNPYPYFTQDDALDAETDKILPREVLARQGTTLDQLGALVAHFGLGAEVHHAGDETLGAFRANLFGALTLGEHYVIANYLRPALGQQIGGHISPIAAYDDKQDRFLVLDVARYKYPPVWVSATDLYSAMNTTDMVSGKTRGYVLVSKRAQTQ